MSTKEKIIENALELFSQKGYGSVSVRDISRSVGIKESSLYSHFKNKQDIFDTIVELCFQKAELYFEEQMLPFNEKDDLDVFYGKGEQELTEMILRIFSYFFEDSHNIRFRQLLTISQYENPRAKEIYRKLYSDYPIQIQSRIFQILMDRGEFRREDPQAAAREFYGPIFMLIHTCDGMKEAEPLIRTHMEQFLKSYRRETSI